METVPLRQTNLIKNSRPFDTLCNITSVHIRSTDKWKETQIIAPLQYFKVLKFTCVVHKHLCASKLLWIASDDDENRRNFASILNKDSTMMSFETFGIHIDKRMSRRYSSKSLLNILTDLDVISKSRLVKIVFFFLT